MLPGEIGVLGVDRAPAEDRAGRAVEPLVVKADGRLLRRAQDGGAVVGVEVGRLEIEFAHWPLTGIMDPLKL
jgi:hypothetical protein